MEYKRSSFDNKFFAINLFTVFHINILLLGVQVSSVRFPKDSSSCCEWFIVTADFGGFREVKHLLIIFCLYRFFLNFI